MLFSRRDIQRFICNNSRFMKQTDIVQAVNELNRNSLQSFHREWEMAILFAVSKHLEFEYEVPLPSGRKPDITIRNCSRSHALIRDGVGLLCRRASMASSRNR